MRIADRMPAGRARRLRALSAWHREWAARHLPQAPFRPEDRPAGTDYQQHYLDVDTPSAAEDEYMDRARRIMGLDPGTGRAE